MNDNQFLKIFSVVAFLAFAAVSCWATAESLHLLLPDLPSVLCWVVTIGFFFIASWGSKMVVDSLNQDIYMEKRGATLIGGIIIVLVFWLFCSMPTNTHTFFFRNLIQQEATQDISTTKSYLAQIKDNVVTEDKIRLKCAEVQNRVDVKLGELKAEIENDANPGYGPKAKSILNDFADILGVVKIEPLTYKGNSVQDRQKLYEAYKNKIYILLESKWQNIIKEMTDPNDEYRRVAEKKYKNLEVVEKSIKNKQISLTDAQDVKVVCERLDDGYVTIKNYEEHVDFKSEADRKNYTAPNPENKIKRLLSVYDVWIDFLTGKHGGMSFAFWILVSILVDLAAFIFFDIAFKKRA